MKLEDALTLFKISEDSSQQDLVSAYRRLVKRYHPDYNGGRLDWAHRRMTQINEAYALACAYLEGSSASPQRDQPRNGAASPRGSSPGHTAGARTGPEKDSAAPDPRDLARVRHALSQVLDGVYTYYQYGLQNVHRRGEGVARLRYRKALRHLKSGISALEDYQSTRGPTFLGGEDIRRLNSFARSFLQNMQIEKYYVPSPSTMERKAYRHFQTGSEHLDRVIQWQLFNETLLPGAGPAQSGSLYVCNREFLTILANYTESSWVPEAMIKLHLADTFSQSSEAGCFSLA